MNKREIEDLYPLTPMQQGMLFHSLHAPASGMYFEQTSWTLKGDLDLDAFKKSWRKVVERHTILRSAFIWEGVEELLQVVYRQVVLPMTELDWREESSETYTERLQAFLEADRRTGFDLMAAPLMRVAMIRRSEDSWTVVWSHHHVLIDGWSVALLMQELFGLYEGYRRGMPLALAPAYPFKNYVAWLKHQDLTQAEAYWRGVLNELRESTPSPLIAGGRSKGDGDGYEVVRTHVPADITRTLIEVARDLHITLYTLLQGAMALMLGTYTRQNDVVFGATVSGRPPDLPHADEIIGLFINSLPVRVRICPDELLSAWLQKLHAQQAEMRQYEFTPLVQVQGWSGIPRDRSLFETLLVFENYPTQGLQGVALPGLTIESGQAFSRTNFPLTIAVSPGSELGIEAAYDGSRSGEKAVRDLVANFCFLLRDMGNVLQSEGGRAVATLSSLSLLPEPSREQILHTLVPGVERSLPDGCVIDLFENQAEAVGDSPALAFKDRCLTYHELNSAANRVAQHLRGLGVGPDVPVGLCVERSTEMIVGMLGILKAGGAYVPLDPSLPSERIAYIIDDSGIAVLLTQEKIAPHLPGEGKQLVLIDADWPRIAPEKDSNVPHHVSPLNLAYVIYTSGSTGRPKGVGVTHRGLMNHATTVMRDVGVISSDRLLQLFSLSFDASVEEIFPALISGATLIIHPLPTQAAGGDILESCTVNGITILHAPVALWHHWVDELTGRDVSFPPQLHTVVVGGESPSAERLERWMQIRGNASRFVNVYGPTETTVAASNFKIARRTWEADGSMETIPIGRPLDNVRIYLLDPTMHLVPPGVPGEICIGGAGVSRGYLRRPELTARSFVPDPFAQEPGARLYRSGDLGRYREDGEIEFLGRIDRQVKIRGYRIEPEEIESCLAACPGVRETAVVPWTYASGDRRIVAYIVKNDATLTNEAVRQFLADRIPEFMLPAVFVEMPKLPLTPTGKVDRNALPSPEDSKAPSGNGCVAPHTVTEELLAGIWETILSAREIGTKDNFFERGGHSLLATQLASRIRDVFDVEYPLQEVFEFPILEQQAKRIEELRVRTSSVAALGLEAGHREQDVPLSYSQQRLWFLDQLSPGGSFYNIPAAFRLRGHLDLDVLERCLTEIVRRHEVLRTSFRDLDGKPVQVVSDQWNVQLPVEDVTGADLKEKEEAVRVLGEDLTCLPFDLMVGPLFRIRLTRLAEEDHVLLFVIHHIIADGWSLGVLAAELGALYPAFQEGSPSPLAALKVQYADFASWQRRYLIGEPLEEHVRYWKDTLHGIPPLLELPTDRPRPALQSFEGARRFMKLSGELSEAIRQTSRSEGVTVFMTLLAVFQVLLHRYTGQQDVVVGTPVAGRRHTALEGLIGFFVNNLVMRTTFASGDTFSDVLHNVRESALGALAHQDLPFERLVEEFHPIRDMSHAPIFQVMFVLQNLPFHGIDLPGLSIEGVEVENRYSNFDVSLVVHDSPEGILAEMEYSTALFDGSTIERMLRHLENLLRSCVSDPGQKIVEAALLSEDEEKTQLIAWNRTASEFPGELAAHEVFERVAGNQPETLALLYAPRVGGQASEMTYRELDHRSNQLARRLKSMGVRPESRVGIFVERSFEMVVGILGILKAGAAFVPLDPGYPQDRIAFMIGDAGLALVLTQQELLAVLPNVHCRALCLDGEWSSIATEESGRPRVNVLPDNLAYVIYTSGSTGKPKGTMLAHRGLCNLARVQGGAFGISSQSRVMQFSSLSFDASVWETVMALLNGGTLCLTSREVVAGGQETVGFIRQHRITTVTLPPSVLAVFPEEQLPELKTIITAGERCNVDLVARWGGGRQFVNAYGPTETTVCASMYECDPQRNEAPPIGKPIGNFSLYILDAHMVPLPVGVPGELYIGGIGLARGYLGRPDLTADKFVPNPFAATRGERLYRSGDLCRYRSDGAIEFLGRIDFQVKVRGFRIELGEIEAALSNCADILDATVIVREDRPGDRRLVAYIVSKPDAQVSVVTLKDELRAELPEYMVPSAFVFLPVMPLSPSGKVDRNALPVPESGRAGLENAYTAPTNDTESTLAEIVGSLLGIDRVGIHDNFFELGGHSLLATQFISRVRNAFGVALALRAVFEKPTVAELAQEIERCRLAGEEAPQQQIHIAPREHARVKRSDLLAHVPNEQVK